MESIRQGANENSRPFQANGLLQTPLDYNTGRKKIGEVIGSVEKPCCFHASVGAPGTKEAPESEHDEDAQQDDVVDFGTVPHPILRGRQIPTTCRITGPAILVAAFRDFI